MQSSFEAVAEELGLSPDDYRDSVLLKKWVLQNMDSKYVPSYLLEVWGLVKEQRGQEAA